MINGIKKYLALGIGHGINDCISGYVIGALFFHDLNVLELGIYALLYNVLAFGGQLLFAGIYESAYHPKYYLAGSIFLLIGALLTVSLFPLFAVVMSGVASAIIHVTGGTEATRDDDRAYGIGLFAAPGVVGLIGGGILAHAGFDLVVPGIIISILYLIYIRIFYHPSSSYPGTGRSQPVFENHDVIMCVLITVICMRSFIWDVVILVENGNYTWLIILGISAMTGKVIGGFISDHIGQKRYTMIALMLALPFLTLLKRNLIALVIGVAILQSTIPATTAMVIRLVRSKPALGISLSFGIPVLIAISVLYTPLVMKMDFNTIVYVAIPACLILLVVVGKMARRFNDRSTGPA